MTILCATNAPTNTTEHYIDRTEEVCVVTTAYTPHIELAEKALAITNPRNYPLVVNFFPKPKQERHCFEHKKTLQRVPSTITPRCRSPGNP